MMFSVSKVDFVRCGSAEIYAGARASLTQTARMSRVLTARIFAHAGYPLCFSPNWVIFGLRQK